MLALTGDASSRVSTRTPQACTPTSVPRGGGGVPTVGVGHDRDGARRSRLPTGSIGKYLNGYFGDDIYVPPGWTAGPRSRRRTATTTIGCSTTPTTVEHGSAPRDYSTDAIRRLSSAFVNNTPADTPLFLMAATYAPHGAFIAAPRHDGTFRNAPVHLGPAVNEPNVADKPAYIRDRPILSSGVPLPPRTRTRNQWETLLVVDRAIGGSSRCSETPVGSPTRSSSSPDNGLLNQEHRWAGKEVPYEESIRVPMVMSFPGIIPEGSVSSALVSNVDLASTIADFRGCLRRDGVSLRPLLTDTASSARSDPKEHLRGVTTVPSYCGVRTPSFLRALSHRRGGACTIWSTIPGSSATSSDRGPTRRTSCGSLTQSPACADAARILVVSSTTGLDLHSTVISDGRPSSVSAAGRHRVVRHPGVAVGALCPRFRIASCLGPNARATQHRARPHRRSAFRLVACDVPNVQALAEG